MKKLLSLWVVIAGLSPLVSLAQTSTWVGGSGGNVFNVAANWSPASVPGGSADLVFNTTTNANIGFNTLPYTANSLTFTSAATNQFFVNGNGGILTLNSGITTQTGSGGANFSNGINIALGANQTWTTASTVTINGNVSGAFSLMKAGSGSLVLNGTNSYSGGTTISSGGLYLGSANSSSGTISVSGTGTLGTAFGDLTLSNAMTLSSGATLGGSSSGGGSSIDLSGTVTLASATSTLNIGAYSDINFSGTLTGPASTALTVHSDGTGIAILKGTVSNVTSMTVDNAAIAFGNTGALSLGANSLQATNGGYISVADVGATTPTMANVLTAIGTNKASFNGTLGFDTSQEATVPTTYTENIDLTGFTAGQVRIGSATSAVLTGTITPVAQSYDFGGYAGQGGFLAVKSALTDHVSATGVSVVSPSASGGAPQNGMGLILQGANTYTGNLSVSYSTVILDSATALPSGTISLGAYSYAGYTESAGYGSFANFAAKVTSYTGTSILGIDSHGIIDNFINNVNTGTVRTLADATIDLSGFSSIYLGSQSGATVNSTTIIAPGDHVLRLANMSGNTPLTINTVLDNTNDPALVVGMAGSGGLVTLNGANTYAGGTTLLGGGIRVGADTALGSGALAVSTSSSGSDMNSLGSTTNGITLNNNISVTNFLQVGTGGNDNNGNFVVGTNSLTLGGIISGTGGHLYITGPTTVSGTNTYTGGTYVEANTSVGNASALGSGFVDMAYGAILTLNSNLGIGLLSDANNFIGGAGTGSIALGSNTLTITQSSGSTFTGGISGTGGIVKAGTGSLALFGTNSYSGGTTVNGGFLVVSNNANLGNTSGGVTFASGASTPILQFNTSLGTVSRAFNFNAAGTIQTNTGTSISTTLSGAFSGSGTFTKSGNGRLALTGSGTGFTGGITVAGGTLVVDGNFSSAGATLVNNSSKLYGAGSLGSITVAAGSFLGGASATGGPESLDATSISFQNGSKMDVFLTTMTAGSPGSGWSLLNISGALNFNGSPVTIDLFSVNGSGVTAPATFNSSVSSQYLLASAGSITGFSGASIITTGFTNSFSGGSFSASTVGNNLYLNYTAPIPEPATFGALAGVAGLALAAWRRRRVARA